MVRPAIEPEPDIESPEFLAADEELQGRPGRLLPRPMPGKVSGEGDGEDGARTASAISPSSKPLPPAGDEFRPTTTT